MIRRCRNTLAALTASLLASALVLPAASSWAVGEFALTAVGPTSPAVATAKPMKDLGTFGGPYSEGLAINDLGQVTGSADASGDRRHAFRWTPAGGLQDINTAPGAVFSVGTAINVRGQVAGEFSRRISLGGRVFRWTPTRGATDLGSLFGHSSGAAGINIRGQVVGSSDANQGTDPFPARAHAVIWKPAGGIQDLGTLGGSESYGPTINGPSSDGNAINDLGQVAGTTDTKKPGLPRAFRWTPTGGMKALGTLGGVASEGVAINALGQVAGNSDTRTAGVRHAFRWTPTGGMQDLGTLGGTWSSAAAINARGQIIGTSETTIPGIYHAFLWSPTGGMRDLGTLGGPTSNAAAINDLGQITGFAAVDGNDFHAYRWTPGGMQDLGTLGGGNSRGIAVNIRGQVTGVANTRGQVDFMQGHAFIWSP